MQWTRFVAVVAGLCFVGIVAVAAQGASAKNPLEGDAAAIRTGMGLFRGRCADCHGMDARGVRGPDITQVGPRVAPTMAFQDDQGGHPRNGDAGQPARVRARGLADPGLPPHAGRDRARGPPRGNAENGQTLFRAMCASCHRVNGTGGRLGPDLSRVGVAIARELVTRIRGAVEGFLPGLRARHVDPAEWASDPGVKKNEDLFSVQIMDIARADPGIRQGHAEAVQDGTQSAMPPSVRIG